MLPDLERKLHRILVNFPGPQNRHQMPGFKLLENKTGRRKQDIIKGLQFLEDTGFIVWSDKSTTDGIVVLKFDSDPAPKKNMYRDIDYWSY